MAENPFAAPAEIRPAAQGLISVEQQRAVAEVQARMLIARANPRDPMRAVDQILQDCTRVSLAEGALYQYARGGTDISGPSIKLAESIARRWGNIASGIKEVERRDGYSECIAYSWDLETGYYDERQFHVRHWRDTKQGGYRVTDERDIYEMIANMGQRRKRAVLLAVIPGDVVEAAVQQCEETLHTKADTSPEAIRKMVEAFAEFGVTKEQIEARCQRRLEAIRPAQIVMLRRIYASLKDEMSAPGDWFEPAAGSPPPPSALRGNEALRSRLEGAVAPPPAPPPDSQSSSPAPDEPAQTSAAVLSGAATPAAEVTPLRTGLDEGPPLPRPRGRPRKPPPAPAEAEIERSQEASAALDPEEDEEEAAPWDPLGPDPSALVPHDPSKSIQSWFGAARLRLREFEAAGLPPERFTAYRKANFGALERLRRELPQWFVQIDDIITAGQNRR
jgi:hypothetical protein